MDARLQRRVQRYGWDLAAESYDSLWQHQLAPAQAEMLALSALKSGDRVIDLACGTGGMLLGAVEHAPYKRVAGQGAYRVTARRVEESPPAVLLACPAPGD